MKNAHNLCSRILNKWIEHHPLARELYVKRDPSDVYCPLQLT